MNSNDEHNERIRREGGVFVDGRNTTRCSYCGAQGAEYDGTMNDAGETIALCPDGCYDRDEDEADDWAPGALTFSGIPRG